MVSKQRFHLHMAAAALLGVVALVGCQSTRSSNDSVVVAPLTVGQPTALDAYHVAMVMRDAGFADEQILAWGTDLRNAVAQGGGAKVLLGHATEVLLAVDGHHLHVTSRRGTTRTYDLLERAPQDASAADDRAAPFTPTHPAMP